jgi:hypothetical protein
MGIVGFLPKGIIPGKSGWTGFHRADAQVASPPDGPSMAS